jgi:hypothetical protein
VIADWQDWKSHQLVEIESSGDNCQLNPSSAVCVADRVGDVVDAQDVADVAGKAQEWVDNRAAAKAAQTAERVRLGGAGVVVGGAAGAAGAVVVKRQKTAQNQVS